MWEGLLRSSSLQFSFPFGCKPIKLWLYATIYLQQTDLNGSWILNSWRAFTFFLATPRIRGRCSCPFCVTRPLYTSRHFHRSRSQKSRRALTQVKERYFVFQRRHYIKSQLCRVVLSCREQMFPWIKYMLELKWSAGVLAAQLSSCDSANKNTNPKIM